MIWPFHKRADPRPTTHEVLASARLATREAVTSGLSRARRLDEIERKQHELRTNVCPAGQEER